MKQIVIIFSLLIIMKNLTSFVIIRINEVMKGIDMKKIIMTGGGTAGHVNPNIALMPRLKDKNFEIKYIGSKDGIEKEIIENINIPYYPISSGKLRRYFAIKNFTDPFRVLKGYFDARKILKREKPDILFSKGGFVSVPVVAAASHLKIPVLSHESDITPGLANKIGGKFSDNLLVTFPETLDYVGDKGILVGSPIREELYHGDKVKLREKLDFDNKPVLLVMGGSIGSVIINKHLRENLKTILKDFNVIHLCGKNNIKESLKYTLGYIQFEYVSDEMKDILALADLIISRSGANSIFEFLALKKPNILIPLSKGSRGDQVLNAISFKEKGYSFVIEEEKINSKVLLESINYVYKNKEDYIRSMEKSELLKSNENIVKLIVEKSK